MGEAGELGGAEAHHGAPVGVEAHGRDEGKPRRGGAGGGRLDLFLGRHGLDPEQIDPTLGQGRGLLGEGGNGRFGGEGTQRLEELACRPDRAGDHHGPAGGIGDAPGDPGRLAIVFAHLVLLLVQLQAIGAAPEAVGEDDVRSRLDHAAVKRLDALGMLEVPELGRIAAHEAHGEEVGAGGAVREKEGALGQKLLQSFRHGADPSPSRPERQGSQAKEFLP